MDITDKIQRRLLISGHVQGVGYRYAMTEQARNVGVAGWCRNLPDGRVEALVNGTRQQVEAMISWAQQGPSAAVVDDVAVSEADRGDSNLNEFEIRR